MSIYRCCPAHCNAAFSGCKSLCQSPPISRGLYIRNAPGEPKPDQAPESSIPRHRVLPTRGASALIREGLADFVSQPVLAISDRQCAGIAHQPHSMQSAQQCAELCLAPSVLCSYDGEHPHVSAPAGSLDQVPRHAWIHCPRASRTSEHIQLRCLEPSAEL